MNLAALLCSTVLLAATSGGTVDFDSQVVPVLTKAGCNAGACHGAAAGRGGFHLSLWGSDPAADYETIVHAYEGRRINLARPRMSLLLRKPTAQLNHGGDMALDPDGAGARRLLSWIESGASRGTRRELTHFEVSPTRYLAQCLPGDVQLRALARFDDGPAEDVTQWTVFTSTDTAAVAIDADRAQARAMRRGQHVVVARFLDRVIPLQIVVPLGDTPVDLSGEPRTNFIDQRVLQALTVLRIPVSPPTDDAAFLRRVRLDLTGRLPDIDEIELFLAEARADKRVRLVDRLLSSDAFADYWTLRFARLLWVHSLPNEAAALRAYTLWLRHEIAADRSLDEVARQLLTATGDSHAVGPANFARMVGDARGQAELVGEFFLGVRLGCANCHNHPLDRWTQDDYHGLAGVFARLERGRDVRWASRGAVTNVRTGEPAVPRIPGVRYLASEGDHRVELAEWLIEDPQRYFARATVNRLWQALFGRGLVDPTDDLRDTNPATHPELLQQLADDFVQHGYSVRHTLREIAISQTYGRSGRIPSENAITDERFYAHAYRRPLTAEVLADAIADVTGVANLYGDLPRGSRAVTLVDPLAPAPSLDILGRCTRRDGCDTTGTAARGLPAQLHLLNGEVINAKLADRNGRLQRLIDQRMSDGEIVTEFILRAFGRRPSDDELKAWCDRLATTDSQERRERLEDFVWSLLNSRQFREND